MRRILASLLFGVFLLPSIAIAEDAAVTRRDGFLLLWETLKRPTTASRETPFIDVQPGDPGFEEITYAKYRGLLLGDTFEPDNSLFLDDALLWYFRTRNIDDLAHITKVELPQLLRKYHLREYLESGKIPIRTLSRSDLSELVETLDNALQREVHEVSLYAEKFDGKGTACGEAFDMYAMTAAHRTLPCNTLVRVTNLESGQSVVVRINDRGPYVKGRDMDLSLGAFTSIAPRSRGKINATFERLGDAFMVEVDRGPRCPTGRALERRKVRLAMRGLADGACVD
jgi:rare lipoprotein A